MNRKHGIIIISIILIASISTIFVVQAKRQPSSKIEYYSEVLSLQSTDSSVIARFEPSTPKILTIWVLGTDEFDEIGFRIVVHYNGKSVIGYHDQYEFEIHNNIQTVHIFERVSVVYPVEVEIQRSMNIGDNTETFEIQWIIEDP